MIFFLFIHSNFMVIWDLISELYIKSKIQVINNIQDMHNLYFIQIYTVYKWFFIKTFITRLMQFVLFGGCLTLTSVVKYYVLREFKLPVFWSFCAEWTDHPAVNVKYLNSVVIAVRNYYSVCIWYGNVMWMFQLSNFISVRSKFTHKCSIRLKHL